MRLHPVVALATCILLVASGVTYARRHGSPISNLYSASISAPSDWVAFQSTYENSTPGDARKVVGRMFRASNGSTRRETGPSLDDIRVISIQNVAEEKAYVLMNGTWYSHPMRLPPQGFRPQTWREDKAKKSELTADSLDLYVYTDVRGSSYLMAPALNFFRVVSQRIDGSRQVHANIRLGEPEAAYFSPPQGAAVTACPEPAGIVFGSYDDPAPTTKPVRCGLTKGEH